MDNCVEWKILARFFVMNVECRYEITFRTFMKRFCPTYLSCPEIISLIRIQIDDRYYAHWDRRCFGPVCHSVNLFILSFCKSVANSFWSVRVRDLIFHMSIPIRKTFPWIPTILTLWSWLCTLTYFLRTLNLLITVEHQQFWPCDLVLGVWPI